MLVNGMLTPMAAFLHLMQVNTMQGVHDEIDPFDAGSCSGAAGRPDPGCPDRARQG
ncbi:hypothetical protein AERO8C_150121 [Aeromonas veronii]|uniref:Uncharacterized protein n=1 Tax=Aeromonas veronii TaxID=654 RepID=A0A653KV32_AERVE|nr:hypothetical protein AERO8C_150121 [Aeromonas veronii]